MKFYFDESGDFSPAPVSGEHKTSLVIGVDIPEVVENEVFDGFRDFLRSLSQNEFDRGEPKGRLLSDASRNRFCLFLANHPVIIRPVVLDLTALTLDKAKEAVASLIRKLEESAPRCLHETMAQDVRLLAKQIANLSLQQNLRLITLAKAIFHSMKHCIICRYDESFNSCWDTIAVHIDAVQRHHNSRERLVFEKIMLAWMTFWTIDDPIAIIREVHTKDHPFIQNYKLKHGVDLGALFRNNISWPTSSETAGLQIADMCATINSLATRTIVNSADLSNYGIMMTRAVGPLNQMPGLLTLGAEPVDLGSRYVGLIEAIKYARRTT